MYTVAQAWWQRSGAGEREAHTGCVHSDEYTDQRWPSSAAPGKAKAGEYEASTSAGCADAAGEQKS